MGFLNRLFRKPEPVPEWARFMPPEKFRAFREQVHYELETSHPKLALDVAQGTVTSNEGEPPTILTLDNVAQICNQMPRSEWHRLLSTHLNRAFAPEKDAPASERVAHDFEAARRMLRIRLYPAEELIRGFGVCQDTMDGVIAALVFDLPDKVAVVKREDVLAWKQPVNQLFGLAASNVRSKEPVNVEQADIGGGLSLTVLSADHHFAASHALFLSDYLDPNNHWGALVAVPNRHAIVLYPIVDQRAMTVVNVMIQTAHNLFQEGPGSISPNLYWWRDGEFLLLPARVVNHETEFTPPDEFAAMMTRFLV